MTISRRLPHRDLPLNPSNEIDVELLAFIERYATNLARWDLLAYFGRNPSARDTARGIAAEVRRRTRIVQKELDDLTFLGVLRAHENGKGMVYELARAPKTRRAVVRFAQRHGKRSGNGRGGLIGGRSDRGEAKQALRLFCFSFWIRL